MLSHHNSDQILSHQLKIYPTTPETNYARTWNISRIRDRHNNVGQSTDVRYHALRVG